MTDTIALMKELYDRAVKYKYWTEDGATVLLRRYSVSTYGQIPSISEELIDYCADHLCDSFASEMFVVESRDTGDTVAVHLIVITNDEMALEFLLKFPVCAL